ncbi:MAG: hypothetical protein JNK53_00255 [Phycisphaerae bacterium]|nr:hypothetical protein [Phycisphaerae bacterium]
MDTCSQTWSAALAVWAGLLAWRGVDAARAGRVDWCNLVALFAVFAVGLNIKEIFYGWSAGIGCALLAVLVCMWRSDRGAALRASWLVVPIIALPVAHLALRLSMGWLSAPQAVGDRYSVNLGDNLVLNSAYSLAVVFTNGPLHLLADDQVSPLLRVLPVASIFASFCIVATAAGFWMLHRAAPNRAALAPAVLVAGAAILSLAVTIPMDSVSELYGLGANVGAGALVVWSLVALWNPVASDERTICRGIAALGGVTLVAVGCFGLAGRAHHFDVTWQYTRLTNAAMIAHQDGMSDQPADPMATLFFAKACYVGPSHSTYIVTPIRSVSPEYTEDWLNRRDPKHKIAMSIDVPVDLRPGLDGVIDCANMPVRRRW